MDNTYDLLNQILYTVSRIEHNSQKSSKVDSSVSKISSSEKPASKSEQPQKSDSASKNLFGNKNILSVANINSSSLKEAGQGLSELSKGLMSYMKVRLFGGKKALSEIHNFLLSLNNVKGQNLVAIGTTAQGIAMIFNILSDKKVIQGLRNASRFKTTEAERIRDFLNIISNIKTTKDPKAFRESILAIQDILNILNDKKTLKGIKNSEKLTKRTATDIKDFFIILTSIKTPDPKKLAEGIKCVQMVIDLISDKKTIRGLIFASNLNKKQAENINSFLKTLASGLSNVDIKKVEKGTKGVKDLTKAFIQITLAIGILVLIGVLLVQTRKPLEILGVVGLIVLATVGILWSLVKFQNIIKGGRGNVQELSKSLFAIAGFITLLIGISMLLLALRRPEIVLAITGALLLATVGILFVLSKVSNGIKKGTRSIGDLGKAMLQITATLAVLILIAGILSMMNDPWRILTLTGALILGEMALVLAIGFSSKLIGNSDKGIKGLFKSIIALTACIAVLVLIAIIINSLSNPMDILMTTVKIVGGMLAIILLIGLFDKVFNLDRAGRSLIKLGAGLLLLTAVMAILMLCISYVMIPLINKINNTEGFWPGLGAVATVIVGLLVITTILGMMIESKTFGSVLIKGAVAMFGLTIVLYLLGLALNPLIDISLKLGEQPGTFWKGFGSIVGVLVIVIIITAILGALVGMTGVGALIAGAGVLVMVGLAGVIWAMSKAFDALVNVSLKIGEQPGTFWKGMKEIGKVLLYTIGFLTIAGTLSPFLALGEAVLLPFGLLMNTLGSGLDKIIDVALKIGNQKDRFWSGLKGISKVITELIKSLSDVGIISMAKLPFISKALKPLFEALAMFTDIILKMENQTFVTGYDDKGKPIYEKLNPDYKKTGEIIGTNFLDFLDALLPILDKVDSSNSKIMKKLGKSLLPLIDSFSKYTDVLLKMADPTKLKLIDHYDEKGMPVYSNKDIDIKVIAGNIAGSFISFINELDLSLRNNIDPDKIKSIGKAMDPIVNVLGSFIDSMLKIDEKVKTANWKVTAKDLAGTIKDLLSVFMDDKFIAKVDEYYGGWFEKSQFKKVDSAINSIGNAFDKFGKILELSSAEKIAQAKRSIVLTGLLGTFLYKISSGTNIFTYIKEIDTDDIEDVGKALVKLQDCFKHLEEISKTDVSNVVPNSLAFINALNNFTQIEFKADAQKLLTSSVIFDKALIRIDQALTKNKKARLSAMKEFSEGSIQLAESIDRVSKSVRNITSNDKKELEDVVKQLKIIEESRLEGMRVKIEYEKRKEANLAREFANYANQVTNEIKNINNSSYTNNITNAPNTINNVNNNNPNNVNNVNNVNGTNGNSGIGSYQANVNMSDEQILAFAKIVAQEVANSVVEGLTSGIKRVNIGFKNSSDEFLGDLRFEK